WKGFGLFLLKEPTRWDGADGMGFVTEMGNGDPGYDIEYSDLQLSILSRLYITSFDPRVLRVTNLLLNAQCLHLDRKTMIINGTYGSRHNTKMPFLPPAAPVLVWLGGRADLEPMLRDQFDK